MFTSLKSTCQILVKLHLISFHLHDISFFMFLFPGFLCLYILKLSIKEYHVGFCIQSINNGLLIEIFSPFKFNIIIDLVELIATILLFTFSMTQLFLFSHFLPDLSIKKILSLSNFFL